jgi:two-component system LytT family response regulator
VRLLREHADLEVVGQAADGEEALELLHEQRPDVVFLDIQMPGLDGVAVAEAARGPDHTPLVVFVTAFDEHAVRAFELEAADYVLKPFDRERLQQVLERLRRRLRRAALDDIDSRSAILRRILGAGDPGGPDRLVLRESGTVFFLRPDEVDWVESAGNYVRVFAQGRQHLIRDTVTAMEERLERHGFLRISRSVVLNLARVRQVLPGRGGTQVAVLENGKRLTVSRRSVPDLRRTIERLR